MQIVSITASPEYPGLYIVEARNGRGSAYKWVGKINRGKVDGICKREFKERRKPKTGFPYAENYSSRGRYRAAIANYKNYQNHKGAGDFWRQIPTPAALVELIAKAILQFEKPANGIG
jgi:hypothetical protein